MDIREVVKDYGDNRVLHGVSLSVERGQVICLIGSSGSGKSTLLRCINGLETITSGEIRIDGDVASGPGVDLVGLRRNVGMAFQSFNLFPHMTVLRQLHGHARDH
ncbi:MAG: ATP-binding cassette domain-containing protein [Luteolibacter sp.]